MPDIKCKWTLRQLCELVNHVFSDPVKNNRVEIRQGGFITNAPCLASCLSPPAARSNCTRALADNTEACWTAIARGLLAQREVTRPELLEGEIMVLAMRSGDALARSSTGVDAAVRRMHTHLTHASLPDVRRMLQAARAPQTGLDALARFSCDHTVTQPKIPRGVSVLLTLAPWTSSGFQAGNRMSASTR